MKLATTSSLARPLFALCFGAALTLSGCEGCGEDPPGTDGGGDAGDIEGRDGGDLPDGGEDGGTDAGPTPPTEPIRDPSPNDPNNANLDSDCDGLSDLEEFSQTWAGGLRTDPANWDSDGDGIADGIEAGRTAPIDPDCPATWLDADPSTTTNPTVTDTDGDCIPDGLEDANRNGRVDPGETDPNNPDSDGDGIPDGEEDGNCNGVLDDGETDPANADSDGDGLNDGVELALGTDPLNPDTDGDGIPDGVDPDPLTPTPDSDGDGIADDIELANSTDPFNPDTDGDGLCDGPNTVPGVCEGGEDLNANGLLDPGETDPLEPDTDCDGLSDLQERALGTNPRALDSDGDLIPDGVEVGNTSAVPGSACPTPPFDADPSTTTNPLLADTDGDGLNDGIEDRNRDGKVDPPPADPRVTAQETDPTNPDTDGDGLCDGPNAVTGVCVAGEDRNRNGRVDGNETDPNVPDVDSDGDGLNDNVELGYCEGPGNCLNPNNPDTDGDGLTDGDELYIHNTNPLWNDTDCDGISDGDEVNVYGTDPLVWDSDGDGLSDGVEVGKTLNIGGARCASIFVPDADPATTTNPLDPDTDGDGVLDGAEDGNQNGAVDPGELNPNDASDAQPGTPVANACANPILPNLHQQQPADALLATHPDFPLANAGVIRRDGQVVGLTTTDPTNGMVGFVVRTTPEGASALAQLATVTSRISGTTVPIEQPFTTWDGFDAARGTYNCGSGCQDGGGQGIENRGQRLVRRILNRGATDGSVDVPFVSAPSFSGPVKLGLQVVQRSATTAVVVGAITSLSAFDDPATGRDFRLEDIYGGSALAQVGDTIGTECDRFTGQVNQKVDFIWIVDDSGSMAAQQQAVQDAAAAMGAQLANSTLDWRIGVVTTAYWTTVRTSGTDRTVCDFVTTAAGFNSCMSDIGIANTGDERGWQSLQRVLTERWLSGGPTPAGQPAVANRIRADAQVVVVAVADSGDQSRSANGTGGRAEQDVAGWTAWAAGGSGMYTWDPTRTDEPPLILNGIICPLSAANGNGCSGESDSTRLSPLGSNYSLDVYYDVINSRGGVVGSLSVPNGSSSAPANEIGDTVSAIMNVVVGQVAPYELSDDPISATIKVAIGAKDPGVPGACPNLADVPRSRQNGFSYDAATNQIAFWGSCRPEVGTAIAASYRTWIDLTADPDGGDQPCGGECSPPFVCINDQCVCPSDCGGNLGPGETCNPATCQPECLDDCGGVCGNGQICDTGSCACTCECANQPSPPPGYPSTFVCDMATCQWSCPADGCDPSTKPAGDNWVCGASCTWTCPDDCGDPDIGPTERCNKSTCQVECPVDCNAQCGGFESCNQDTCACECVENATCAPGFAFDAAACGCVCDADALGCPATHVPNLDSCSCDCGDNCNDACGAGTLCNQNTCACVPFGG